MRLTHSDSGKIRKWWYDPDQGLLVNTNVSYTAGTFETFVSNTVPEEFWDWLPEQ